MTGNESRPKGPSALGDAERERTVTALSEAFAADDLTMAEFERRVEDVHRATSVEELRALVSDLRGPRPPVTQGGSEVATARGSGTAPAPRRSRVPANRPQQTFIVGCLGSGVRRGPWTPARYNYAVGAMGGVELDFRECELPPVTELRCFAIMGGVEVIVPPDVVVDASGVGILGGFDHQATDQYAPADAPVLRVTGLALLGGVDIQVRQRGESAKDAKRRRKLERERERRLPGSDG